MAATDYAWLDAAFPPSSQRPLNRSVRDAIGKDPKYLNLFQNIGSYIVSLQSGITDEPVIKKRKLDTPTEGSSPAATTVPTSIKPTANGALLKVEGISFSVPQRKKFTLVISRQSLTAVTPAGLVEFGVELDNIEYICCLPVPDKAARQWNFCIIPVGGSGLGESNDDSIVFTIADGAPKTASGDAMGSGYDTSTYRTLLVDLLNALLKPSKSRISSVEEPNEKIFFSALPQSHRKGEKAFHVKAHRGSKEGYLFFLRRGILWAFKKPLMHFSFGDVESISYSSITKRTFNLSIHVAADRGGAEIEFSMIDQEEFAGIDSYIKLNKLNDASMADQRRAKVFNINGKADEVEEGPGELEKAWDDAEDEEEEDYVPGQDEDDDGSGSDSDSEDSEGDDAGSENMDSDEEGSVDLKEELGSEMEDVVPEAPKPKRVKKVRA
ncbi:hypothetical protein EDC01DRAFT_662913 [Geopyxis carbonaria]|nr:hypothetical protein EDC01DRAFT_662913 [Geopyxis carbonaria]